MSIFSAIKDAIFGHKAAAPAAPGAQPAAPAQSPAMPQMAPGTPAQPVDVDAVLTDMAKSHAEPLNWQSSIVDLMKLVGLDSSLAHRQELATELGYTGDKNDSATMNIWLHKQVMAKLAESGGKVPAELTH